MKSLSKKIELKRSTLHVLIDINNFDESKKEVVSSKFDFYHRNNIIICDDFNSSTWILSNEINDTVLNFSLNMFAHHASKSKTSFEDINYYLRAFIIFKMGSYIPVTLAAALRTIITCFECTNFLMEPDLLLENKNSQLFETLCSTSIYTDFFNSFGIDGSKQILNILNTNQHFMENRTNGKPRNLAEFQSYYYFDRLLNRFWNDQSTTDSEKLYYYPLYLFWKLTTILPQRVNEFCLMPQGCITFDKSTSQYYITIRRTRMKGRGKLITYKVDSDYFLCTYAIPDTLAHEFLTYEHMSQSYARKDFNFFSAECHMKNHPKGPVNGIKHKNVFWRNLLSHSCKDFFEHIISNRYGINVLEKKSYEERINKGITTSDDFLKTNEIIQLQLGDTRHIALINLVLNGCNPLVLYEFAGHEGLEMACHYYSNVQKLMKSYAYTIFIENNKNEIFLPEHYSNKSFLFRNKPYVIVDDGKCYSTAFQNNNLHDCLNSSLQCYTCPFFLGEKKLSSNDPQEESLLNDHKIQLLLLEATLQLKDSHEKNEKLSTILKQLGAQTKGLQKWYYNQFSS
ncbi:MAG: hypothetical protein IKU20_02080 [Lachnospiraceae bacterium]|nr:hypothetical protein [Lachnospiraceae bacterium]